MGKRQTFVVICEADYSLDDFEGYDQARKKFEKIFCDIIERIGCEEEADLSLRSKGVIIKQMGNVAMRLAEKRNKISKTEAIYEVAKEAAPEYDEEKIAERMVSKVRGLAPPIVVFG